MIAATLRASELRIGLQVPQLERKLDLVRVCRQNLLDKLAIELREDLVHLS
jgi:hypothetical protein